MVTYFCSFTMLSPHLPRSLLRTTTSWTCGRTISPSSSQILLLSTDAQSKEKQRIAYQRTTAAAAALARADAETGGFFGQIKNFFSTGTLPKDKHTSHLWPSFKPTVRFQRNISAIDANWKGHAR